MTQAPQTDKPVIVNVRHLEVQAKNDADEVITLVSDINFEVRKGEVLALIGESGSGKTTIALALMGYARHGCRISGGDIELAGTDVTHLSARQLSQFRGSTVAYIAQSAAASFNPAMTLMDQVVEPVLIHGTMKRAEAEKKAVDLFRELALPSPETIGKRYPHQVSGGQLQRVMAAMALIGDPEVVILDEPTTALDVTTQLEVLKTFRRVVKQRGTTAIYVSHDLAVVAQMADKILVLLKGQIAEYGTTEELLQRPQSPYTRSLLDAAQHKPRNSPWQPEAAPLKALLEVRDLAAGYGPLDDNGNPKISILQDINFKLYPGQAIGIIGESGSGKTTLARAVAGMIAPSNGYILFNESYLKGDMTARSPDELRRIQFVFQMADTALNPSQTIATILKRPLVFFHGLRGKALDARLKQLLDLVRLPHSILHRKPAGLSGGQKQRVNLARALAAEPDLILCDEVTSALDSVVAAAVLDLISELRRELNVSFLFISHDLHAVRSVCDDIIVINNGQIATQVSRNDYDKASSSLYYERLKRAVPELRQGWLEEQDGEPLGLPLAE
ncbi:ATP-binding cassette domain-containing protein [Rouxiella chamberiensis]|uniref:ATP-binding cassette domain-containing protein n=1 Tax=Rouxiella chamberiensis TaxID=1513468 RepID=UPI0005D3A6EF